MQELEAPARRQRMCTNLVVELVDLGFTSPDIADVLVKYLRETGPQDVYRYLLEHSIEHAQAIDALHLAFALFVDLNHDAA